MDLLPAPFHFAATFLVTVAALGGAWVTIYRPQFVPSGTWRRWAFGVGWVLLGLGELLHGAQLAASEQDPFVVTLRVGAYVLLVAGIQPLVVTLPARGGAAASMPEGKAAPEPKRRARGTHVPAVRRLVVALSLFAFSEAFFLWVDALSTEQSGGLWLIVHGLRLAGGVAVLAWLGQVVRTSIQARVVAVFIVLLLVVVVAISGSMTQVFTANITQDSLKEASREGETQGRLLDEQIRDSISRAEQVAKLDNVRAAFASRSEDLASIVSRFQTPGGSFESSDFMVFFDPSGQILALSATKACPSLPAPECPRGAAPTSRQTLELPDVLSLTGTDVVTMARSQQREDGSLVALGSRKIAAIGAFPVSAPQELGSHVVGVVVVGRLIDRYYLGTLIGAEGEQAFLITRKEILSRTTTDSEGVIPTGRSQLQILFETGSRLTTQNTIGRTDYFSSYVPIKPRDSGQVIGALVFSKRSDVVRLAQRNVATPLFLIALWATIVGVALSLLLGSRLTQPIRELTHAAERVRGGDLAARVSPRTMDEVGVLGETFDQMTESLARVTHDLRETAEQEVQLRRQRETILQSMTDGVVAVDHSGKIVAFNREAERILEVRQSEAIGQNIKTVLKLRDAEGKAIDPSIYDLRQGSVSGIVGDVRHVSRPVVVTSAPIEDEGGTIIGGVAVVRDQTREVEIEKMKTEFLANISHELRTPITPIKGYSDLMRRKEVPRDQEVTFLDGIIASAERLERIVEMLVDFSAMEAGRLAPKKVPLDFNDVTAELVEKWAQAAPNHQFERKGFGNLPKVKVDRRLVPLAISELMDNAVKFSPNGGKVTLEGEYSNGHPGSGDVRVSVTDEGIGMGTEELSRIGQNFVQADGSETRAYGGLGLGLAYVRRIAEGHGGRLEVESTLDKGSRFTLVFPASSVIH